MADLNPMQIFVKASAEEIAKQLCLIDFRIFGSIRVSLATKKNPPKANTIS